MKTEMLLVLGMWRLGVALASCGKEIHAITNSSIHLLTHFDQSPKDIIWKLKTTEAELQIAKIQNHSMTDRLHDRYSLGDNGRDLYIRNVMKRDNGCYTAEATMADDRIETKMFYLTIHDPVPPPKIIPNVRRIVDQCSVKLNCFVTSKTPSFSLTWKYRNGSSEFQTISNAGNEIEETFPLDQDIEFVCLVRNPADQKNDSVQIKHCVVIKEGKTRGHLYCIVSSVFVAAVVGAMWKTAKTTGQGEDGNKNLTSPVQDSDSQESPFISISLGKSNVKETADAAQPKNAPMPTDHDGEGQVSPGDSISTPYISEGDPSLPELGKGSDRDSVAAEHVDKEKTRRT
ncbi:SLAM family member 5-like [Dendrobates tinctorius]|uniref:SLAM family member 5-like n=1 Tax=Dendrobates tinctorius TaxID=92724 RepID=UPI003CC98BD5